MARAPMVTRTIITTKANVMCLDVEKGEPFNQVVEVSRTYKSEDALLKAVKAIAETDSIKCVHIVDTEVVETLFGMSESKFVETAEKLPPRNTKKEK